MKQHWVDFYKKKHTNKPSSFAKFCSKYIPRGSFITDLGCGNGRDTYYLKNIGTVQGIDYATLPASKRNAHFFRIDLDSFLSNNSYTDVVYSRFFLHTIDNTHIEKIISSTSNYFMAEFRAIGDLPELYPNHKRNFIDCDWLLHLLIVNKFEILYFKKSRGLAKFKGEDPLVARVICRKKH